ncbi:glycosyltransferase family 2 protein [Acetobacter sp. AN02]|uniref:glycosyltransferase family 2 protein n=1 Tax=Acetobacter sp. AN02 TaxID=2894186 RepID=UPI0024342A6D|nr:glycosyltransferase family 2 protein [Acetobacter sp. AN02]MDG6094066.1 glycosyltransferase family 2 protein [Acetobacter sp. AN02]
MNDPSPALSPALSVVIPCHNEQDILPEFHRRLAAVMNSLATPPAMADSAGKTQPPPWEAVYVNDGSHDLTLACLNTLAERDSHIRIISLSRNFGKEIALTAGLDHARATHSIIVIDADLQDPPEVIAQLAAAWTADVDTVCARRSTRAGETITRRLTAWMFYRAMARLGSRVIIPPDTGDFRLISRRLADSLLLLRERHRFMKGLFAWVGFPSRTIMYDRAPRPDGTSSFSYRSLWTLAVEGITSFSVIPLQISTGLGFLISLLAMTYGAWIAGRTLLFGNPVAGYPSLMTVILFLSGVQLMTIGIIGEYVGRIFNETKQRPLYLTDSPTRPPETPLRQPETDSIT